MFRVVEMPTAQILATFPLFEEAATYAESIESSEFYPELLEKYGSLRRVQQELSIELI